MMAVPHVPVHQANLTLQVPINVAKVLQVVWPRCLQVWQVFRIVLQPQLTWHILSRVAGLSKLHSILVVLGKGIKKQLEY